MNEVVENCDWICLCRLDTDTQLVGPNHEFAMQEEGEWRSWEIDIHPKANSLVTLTIVQKKWEKEKQSRGEEEGRSKWQMANEWREYSYNEKFAGFYGWF